MNKVKNLGYDRLIDTQTTLPRIKFLLFFIRALFPEVCYPNLESFVWKRHVCALWRDTNMAAVK